MSGWVSVLYFHLKDTNLTFGTGSFRIYAVKH